MQRKHPEYNLGELKLMLTFNSVAFFKPFQLRTKSYVTTCVSVVDVQVETLCFAVFKPASVFTKENKKKIKKVNLNNFGWILQNGDGTD